VKASHVLVEYRMRVVAPWWYHMDYVYFKRLLRWFCNVRAYTNIIVQEMAAEVWNVGRVRGVGGW
jgi:hypothetical protein